MEFLALMVIYGVARLVKGGTENTSAILKGKEPPEITKFNARRKDGSIAGKLAEAISRPVGRPKAGKPAKEPGPARKVFRAWKANTAATAIDKMQHRHQRRLAWYRDHGQSIEDERWHTRQQAKLKAKQDKLEKLKVRKGLVPPQVDGQVVDKQTSSDRPVQPVPENVANLDEARAKRGEDQAAEQPNSTPTPREPVEDTTSQQANTEQSRTETKAQDPAAGTATPETSTTSPTAESTGSATASTTGGSSMYHKAAEDLHRNAADIDTYNEDLKVSSDDLKNRGYGTEVTGPLADMAGSLQEAAGIMRDVATSMADQGGNVARAYEAAPFAPDRSALVGN